MIDTSEIDKKADSWNRRLITYLNQLDAIQCEIHRVFEKDYTGWEDLQEKPKEKPKAQQLSLFTWRYK